MGSFGLAFTRSWHLEFDQVHSRLLKCQGLFARYRGVRRLEGLVGLIPEFRGRVGKIAALLYVIQSLWGTLRIASHWGILALLPLLNPLAPKALHNRVSGLKILQQQCPGTLRPHCRSTWMFTPSVQVLNYKVSTQNHMISNMDTLNTP